MPLMQKLLATLITIVCFIIPVISYAENTLIDANVFYSIPDAGGTDDFHTGKTINVNYNYYFKPWLAVTGGVFFSEEIFDNVRSDINSTYQSSLESRGITLGLRPEHKFSDRNKVYGRAGILYYDTTLRVSELFEPGISNSSTQSTSGNGFFIAAGWAHSFTQKVTFQLEVASYKQLKLFDGKTSSSQVFDLTNAGFSIGLGYAF